MNSVALTVNGTSYGGWKAIQVTRGMEAVCGGFSLGVSDRWATQQVPWDIREGDACAVAINGATVITGYVDARRIGYDATDHTIQITGRDKAADLVDGSAYLPGRWQFFGQSALEIAKAVAAPFGVTVRLAAGVTLPKPQAKFTINPGETAFEVLDRACRLAGVLPVSDGAGGVVLTRATTARAATELVQGGNILSADGAFDHEQRFHRYVVAGQHAGDDDFYGAAASGVEASAYDNSVRRARILVVRPEGIVTTEGAKKRAEWEASVRAARAGAVDVTVQGWTQGDGSLWPFNALVRLRSPLLGIDGDMLICQVTYELDDQGGTRTRLSLKRPNAYQPEPVPEKDAEAAGVGADPWGVADED